MKVIEQSRLLFVFIAWFIISHANAEIIFEDDFESGSFASFWSDKAYVSISGEVSKESSYSARFHFKGGESGDDAMSELRFDLGQLYTELLIDFDLYIPMNYVHRDDVSTDNNKFFRLWPNDYDDREKLGASLMYSPSGSKMAIDYSKQADWSLSLAAGGMVDRFISETDLGKWMHVTLSIYAAHSPTPAYIGIYKNGKMCIEKTVPLDYDLAVNGYRFGYLLGWANSGFDEDTDIYIDNVVIKDESIDRSSVISQPAAPRIYW